MSHYQSGSNDRVEWPRWAKVLGFAAAVLALVAAIVAVAVVAVLMAGG